MIVRTISAIVYLLIVFPCIYFSATPVFVIFAFLLAFCSVYEMLKCNGLHKNLGISLAAYLVSVLPILPRILGIDLFNKLALPYIFVCAFFALSTYTFMKQKPEIGKLSTAYLFSVYASAGFTSLVLLTELCDGKWYFMFMAFLASWITDTFALLTGMLFGKHKLLPSVSPKKTVEGAIGGSVFCVLFFILYAYLLKRFFDFELGEYWMIAVCGFLCSIVAIIGDLLFSAVKRATGIKDFGKLMPGHGGILDRFDSMISISIVLYLFLSIVNLFI
jgi:phosphatidate cytidylyltransferase